MPPATLRREKERPALLQSRIRCVLSTPPVPPRFGDPRDPTLLAAVDHELTGRPADILALVATHALGWRCSVTRLRRATDVGLGCTCARVVRIFHLRLPAHARRERASRGRTDRFAADMVAARDPIASGSDIPSELLVRGATASRS
jgi:hypothetical protein